MPVVYADKIKYLTSLKQERQSYDDHWQELGNFFLPRRQRWLHRGQTMRGTKMNQNLVDPSARFAARTLSSGMHAGSTNPAMPWFKLTTPDPEMMEFPSVSRWLYTVEQRMRDVFERSNVYSVLPMLYMDGGVFGTAPMIVLEHDTRVIHCVPDALGSYYLATDNDGQIVTKYREFKMTADQMVNQFGFQNCSPQVQKEARSSQGQQYHDVLHVIEPNTGRNYASYDSANMPWRSCYLEMNERPANTEQKPLRESGFEDNPIACLRWEVTEITDPYGASPGMDALGLSKSLQVQTKKAAQAIDKLVDPPMVGDPALQSKASSLVAGDITWAGFTPTGAAPRFQPAYVIKPELGAQMEERKYTRELIQQAMYTDLFLAITIADPRNASVPEIVERRQEKLLMLGPVLQNHRDGLIKPLIDRTFYIMARQGRLPPPPPELEGVDLKVELTGLLAQALKEVASTGIERYVGFIGGMAKAQADAGAEPTILDKIDFDQAADEYGLALGVPPTIIRDDDAVEKIRAERDEQKAKAEAAAMAQPLAQGAKAAKDLSETQVNGQSALDTIVNAA